MPPRKPFSTSWPLAVLLCVATWDHPAAAQAQPQVPAPESDATDKGPSDDGGPSDRERAIGLFKQFGEAFEKEKFEEAYGYIKEAWALEPNFEMAANLGIVEVKLGKYADAANHFYFAFANVPSSQFEYYHKWFDPAYSEAKAQSAKVFVTVSPKDSVVLCNGAPIPAEVFYLAPGTHRIVAKSHSDQKEVTLVLAKNRKERVHIELRREARDRVDEAAQAATPGRSVSDAKDVRYETRIRPAVLWTGLGLSAVLGGVAIVYNQQAAGTEEEIKASPGSASQCAGNDSPDCQSLQKKRESLEDQRSNSVIFGVGSGFVLVGTALTTLLWTERVPVTATVTPQSATLRIHHAF